MRWVNAEWQRSMEEFQELRSVPATDLPLQKESVCKAQTKIHALYEKDVKAAQS